MTQPFGTHAPSEAMRNAVGPSSDLMKVREKIKQGWTTHALARDYLGSVVSSGSERARCWCLSGAACAMGFDAERVANKLSFRNALAMANWNDKDGRTQAEVLARIDAALAEVSQ